MVANVLLSDFEFIGNPFHQAKRPDGITLVLIGITQFFGFSVLQKRLFALLIPQRMRRPAAAREALGLSPLVQARWADASAVKGIPFMSAGAEPFVFLCGATSRRAGSGCANQRNRDSSLRRVRDPIRPTTWQRRLRSRRTPAYESRVLRTPSYPSLRSRFRLHERVELAG
jgi:hypothetical protein